MGLLSYEVSPFWCAIVMLGSAVAGYVSGGFAG